MTPNLPHLDLPALAASCSHCPQERTPRHRWSLGIGHAGSEAPPPHLNIPCTGSIIYPLSSRTDSTASLKFGYLTRGQSSPGNKSPISPRNRGTSSNTNFGKFISRNALIRTTSCNVQENISWKIFPFVFIQVYAIKLMKFEVLEITLIPLVATELRNCLNIKRSRSLNQ